ncbi:MAG: F0F1 ATP synthase subunit B [Candidatus Rokubacteria bacterium]|nr:F0F1 ATP synthase subunit B [Candidatus Rokubacteria bacterium]
MMLRRACRLVGVLCAVAFVALTPAIALAASEGGLINVDKSLIIQILNFGILLFVLHRILYKPFLAKMDERTQAIKKSLDEAQAARAEAARQQEENAARLATAHREAGMIREQALREASEESRKQIETAGAQARKLVEDTRAQMDAEVRRAREDLRREVAEIATAVAEKLVRRSLREEDHRRIVADAITRAGS